MNKEQRIEREKELLKAALECYASDPHESVTIAAIAKKAGVAKGTVYLHFASKNEIFAHLAMQFYETLLSRCSIIGKSSGSAQLEALIKTVFLCHNDEHRYRHIIQYCQMHHFRQTIDHDLARRLDHADTTLKKIFIECLERGMRDGTLRVGTPGAANTADSILCTIHGALQRQQSIINSLGNQMEFIANTTNYILAGLGERSKKQRSNNNQNAETSHSTLDLILES